MEPIPSIRVQNLTRRYGPVTAVHDVSFEVGRGEVVGFLGPNGAGKSTTMRILCGILPATSGSAWVGGVPVAREPREVKRRIGYMPENNPLPGDMRVVEYLRFRARLKQVRGPQLRQAVQEAMEICDLARTARRKIIGTLSKGFRQRVGVADALLGKPEVIIMDEPTIGLDPHQVRGIRDLIDNLRGRLTVVLSSHILPEIERSCDRVIIINRGRLVASGTSRELREEFLPGARLRVEVDAAPETVRSLLAEADLAVTIVDRDSPGSGWHTLTLRSEDTSGEAGHRLVSALHQPPRCRLRRIDPQTPSLEEIFLAATKRSWEETLDGGAPAAPATTDADPPRETA